MFLKRSSRHGKWLRLEYVKRFCKRLVWLFVFADLLLFFLRDSILLRGLFATIFPEKILQCQLGRGN